MGQLSLALLGPLQVTRDGQPITAFVYDKVRALLAFLALEADRPHRRGTLLGLFWPELPEEAARNNLRQALATLRRALGDDRAEPPFLLASRETIQLNPLADCWRDVAVFTRLLDACDRHPHRHPDRCRSCARRLAQAVAMYRGDLLQELSLSDCVAFDEWALLKREAFQQRMVVALTRLARFHEQQGEYVEALHAARRLVELEPWREEAHRLVMRLLWQQGERSAALSDYERCRRLLADELGVEPDDETQALYAAIRSGVPAAHGTYTALPCQQLPQQTTSFIGREAELAQLGELLDGQVARLITVTGAGGIGKTRLALEAAARHAATFDDGVTFVPLASVSSPELVVPAIAGALGITLPAHADPQAQLLAVMREQELLLVLDNFEHLLEAACLLAELLCAAPRLALLVTSRAVLQLSGEQEFPLPPLALPAGQCTSTMEELAQSDAVALFVTRARAVMPDFQVSGTTARTVAEICVRLEGLPLAIELAAARSRVLPPEALLARLSRRLTLLTGGPRDLPPRQRTLRNTIDWSYTLLDADEQRLLQRLAVFVGGWSLPAAEAICGAMDAPMQLSEQAPAPQLLDGLHSLVRKSLVHPASTIAGTPRFTMLETIREYAEERLVASGAEDVLRREHARYYVWLAEAAERALAGPEEGCWLAQLAAEQDNCRAALAWSLTAAPGDREMRELGLRLAGALFAFWSRHGDWSEGRRWLATALAATGELHATPGLGGSARLARARALLAAGTLAWWQGEYRTVMPVLQESECLYRELGDTAGVAAALNARGGVVLAQGDRATARVLFEQALALARQVDHAEGQTFALT